MHVQYVAISELCYEDMRMNDQAQVCTLLDSVIASSDRGVV